MSQKTNWVKEVIIDNSELALHICNGKKGFEIENIENNHTDVSLDIGDILCGAKFGNANLNFSNASLASVTKDLERLRLSKRTYRLLVIAPANASNNQPSPMILQVNNQQQSPSKFHVRNTNQDEHNGNNSFLQVDTSNIYDDNKIMQSLNALKTQRMSIEAFKKASDTKDMTIKALRDEINNLTYQLRGFESLNANHSVLLTKLSVLEERSKFYEQKTIFYEKEISNIKDEASQSVSTIQQVLNQHKQEKEQDKLYYEKQINELSNSVTKAELEGKNYQNSIRQLNEEIDAYKTEMSSLKTSMENNLKVYNETINSVNSKYEASQTEVTNLTSTISNQERMIHQKNALIDQKDKELVNLRNETNMLMTSHNELNETISNLKKQLFSLNNTFNEKTELMSKENNDLKSELTHLLTQDKLNAEKISSLNNLYHKEIDNCKAAKSDLICKQVELQNSQDKITQHLLAIDSLKTEMQHHSQQLNALHSRLLEEMNKNSKLSAELETERNNSRIWAQSKLDLLEQFCDESLKLSNAISTASICSPTGFVSPVKLHTTPITSQRVKPAYDAQSPKDLTSEFN